MVGYLKWIFLFCLRSIRGEKKTLQFTNSTMELKVPSFIEFYDETDIDSGTEICDSCWLLPQKANQGCYDALQIVGSQLNVIQLTVAKKHSLKLRFVAKMLTTLKAIGKNISSVEIIVVVPEEKVSNFKLGEIEGNTGAMKGLWSRQDCILLGFKRSS